MLDRMHATLRRLALGLVVGFVLLGLGLGYWQAWRTTDLATDPANPRVAEANQEGPRGRILDRAGAVLAASEPTPQGVRRRYADPSLVHTIGFHSPRFGDTNLEQQYNAELTGQRT